MRCGRARSAVVRFHPDGASTGAVLKLSREKAEYEIRVNWYTGGVAIETVNARSGEAGFTLLEALVALALVLAFAAALVRTCRRHAASWPMPTAALPRRFFCARCSMRRSIATDLAERVARRRDRRIAMAHRH